MTAGSSRGKALVAYVYFSRELKPFVLVIDCSNLPMLVVSAGQRFVCPTNQSPRRSCDDLDANILANSVKNIILDIRGLIVCHSSCVKVLMHYLRDSVIRPQTEILINESIPWQRVSVRAIVPLVCNCLLTDEWSTDLHHLTVTDFTASPISSPMFSPAVSPAYSPTSPAYSATSSPAFSLTDADAAAEDTIHPSVI